MKNAIFLLGAVISIAILDVDAASVHRREKRHQILNPGYVGDYWSGPQIGGNFGGLFESESNAGSKSLVRRNGEDGGGDASSSANSYSQSGSSGGGLSSSSNSASSAGGNGYGTYSSSNSWASGSG
ncbi:keratin, type I cytoskeletal 10-like [Diprion similis]|uniref:keratin, type I cytoskeletal 10-like n=1 Tax=Diprion similis TaxID=362088 RepID=UPI001EF8CCA4|nr:keratin, type I cytoskeletal 10-like [Diprion similis]